MTTPIDESVPDARELTVLLRLARLAPPEPCHAGILANLALLAHHGAILRRLDDPCEDPAELIAP